MKTKFWQIMLLCGQMLTWQVANAGDEIKLEAEVVCIVKNVKPVRRSTRTGVVLGYNTGLDLRYLDPSWRATRPGTPIVKDVFADLEESAAKLSPNLAVLQLFVADASFRIIKPRARKAVRDQRMNTNLATIMELLGATAVSRAGDDEQLLGRKAQCRLSRRQSGK